MRGEAAYRASAADLPLAAVAADLLQTGVALGVADAVLAAVVGVAEVFEGGHVRGAGGGGFDGDQCAFVRPRPGEGGGLVGADLARVPPVEERIALFLRAGLMPADAAVCGGVGVFGEAVATGKNSERVRRTGGKVGRLALGRGLGDAPAQAFFGQEPGDEGVVAFLVLHDHRARGEFGKPGVDAGIDPPAHVGRIGGEDFIDDLQNGFVLKYAVAARLGGKPDAGHEL